MKHTRRTTLGICLTLAWAPMAVAQSYAERQCGLVTTMELSAIFDKEVVAQALEGNERQGIGCEWRLKARDDQRQRNWTTTIKLDLVDAQSPGDARGSQVMRKVADGGESIGNLGDVASVAWLENSGVQKARLSVPVAKDRWALEFHAYAFASGLDDKPEPVSNALYQQVLTFAGTFVQRLKD